MLHAQLAALVLAATTLAASGCGGSSKTGSTANTTASTAPPTTSASVTTPTSTATVVKVASGAPLTHAQLFAQADAICAKTNKRRSSLSGTFRQNEVSRALPLVASYATAESSELSKLVPPASMAHSWKQILGDFQLYGEYNRAVASEAQTGNVKVTGPLIVKADDLRKKLEELAARSGFTDCSE